MINPSWAWIGGYRCLRNGSGRRRSWCALYPSFCPNDIVHAIFKIVKFERVGNRSFGVVASKFSASEIVLNALRFTFHSNANDRGGVIGPDLRTAVDVALRIMASPIPTRMTRRAARRKKVRFDITEESYQKLALL